jgi:hypothetical protein
MIVVLHRFNVHRKAARLLKEHAAGWLIIEWLARRFRGRVEWPAVEDNPYEAPREQEPLTTGKIVKRSLGVGAIVALTPLAVIIAFGGSCAATYAVRQTPSMRGADLGRLIYVQLTTFLVPPIVVLFAMIVWAIRTHLRNKKLSSNLPEKP